MTAEIHHLRIKSETPQQTAYWYDQKLQLEQEVRERNQKLQQINRILGIVATGSGYDEAN